MEFLENRTFDEINVGDEASLTRTLTERDIQVFAIMSGDINPAHVDIEYAQSDMFHKIIGHGMWGAALISTVLGTELPGPGTIYVGQTLKFKRPVAPGDTLTITVKAIEKKPEKRRIIFSCVCKNQHDEIVIDGNAEVIAPSKKIRREKMVMPEISLRRPYSLFDVYIAKAKKLGALKTGVIHPVHPLIIEAVSAAQHAGLITPLYIGNKEKILAAAKEAGVSLAPETIIDVEHNYQAIIESMRLAREGTIHLIIRGGATRRDLLNAIQNKEMGLLTEKSLSYATVLDVPTYPKAMILTDTMLALEPTLEEKWAITQNAIDFGRALDMETPKVAILSGLDIISSSMRSTIDAAALCKMAERGQIEGGILDGPLTFDTAISALAAKTKGIISPVSGSADILIMPNVETANMLVKQLEYLAESKSAGLLLGARVPILMSHIRDLRASTVSCAFAILNEAYRKTQTVM